MLIDLGFSGSIIALVGDRGSDKAVVGNYIRSPSAFATAYSPFLFQEQRSLFP
jgi:hypothetical protein